MQIKEVSKKTGLSIKTIRFYTERDLVEPKKEERNGRTYKDFSQKDLERLHMIAVLRKCLFSIEQIKTMIDHPELTPDVFSEYREELLAQAEMLMVLAEKAVTMDPESLDGPEVLARKLSHTATPLPLPSRDLDPHFGKLDPETPEERHAAFVKWQKRYKYRHLRWIVPAVVIFVLLTTATMIQANAYANQTLRWFGYVETQLKNTPMKYDSIGESEYIYSRKTTTVYGLYDFNGNLIPYPDWSDTAQRIPNYTVAEIVSDTVGDTLAINSRRDKHLDRGLAKWISAEPFSPDYDRKLIKSNIFSQTLAFTHCIEVNGAPYYLALYYHSTPLGDVFWRHTAIFYLAVLFVYGIIFALSTTKGYGFQVRFMATSTSGLVMMGLPTGESERITLQLAVPPRISGP